MMGLAGDDNYQIETVNLESDKPNYNNISHRSENVLNLSADYLNKFDIIHSNSLIEHLTPPEKQKLFAELIIKSKTKYFIQTPNYYFPIEPHFLFPLFQFLHLKIQAGLLTHFKLGWFDKCKSKKEAESIIKSIRLLSGKELKSLFPNAVICKERFLFLNKSFILNSAQAKDPE
jgi:hypothetical protein